MHFRYARHTNKINDITEFYTKILHIEVLGHFENHQNYDGVFIGIKGSDWYFEFTTTDEIVTHTFDEDDCLVFYPTSQNEYDTIMENLSQYKVEIIEHKNTYWNENGISFLDPDGYCVILSPLKIN